MTCRVMSPVAASAVVGGGSSGMGETLDKSSVTAAYGSVPEAIIESWVSSYSPLRAT